MAEVTGIRLSNGDIAYIPSGNGAAPDMSNYYTKKQIDDKFGEYIDEVAELLGGDA